MEMTAHRVSTAESRVNENRDDRQDDRYRIDAVHRGSDSFHEACTHLRATRLRDSGTSWCCLAVSHDPGGLTGAMPWQGVDAMVVGAQIVLALQTIESSKAQLAP